MERKKMKHQEENKIKATQRKELETEKTKGIKSVKNWSQTMQNQTQKWNFRVRIHVEEETTNCKCGVIQIMEYLLKCSIIVTTWQMTIR